MQTFLIDPPNIHTHICGLQDDNTIDLTQGCGWEWEHAKLVDAQGNEYEEAHMCANCGEGPWFNVKLSHEDIERAKAEGNAFTIDDPVEGLLIDAVIRFFMNVPRSTR